MRYSLPRDAFEILVETFQSKQKAEKFAQAIEEIIEYSKEKCNEEIVQKKELTKIELKEELKNELVTKDIFEERFKTIEERFKSLEFKINILIVLMLIIITFANPTFLEILKKLLGR